MCWDLTFPFIKYNTFYNGDVHQDNARQNTVRLFIKFNLNVNYNT